MNRRPSRQWWCGRSALVVALIGVAGCPPPQPPPPTHPTPPRSQAEIVAVIHANERKLDRALWSSSVKVVARFTDEKGKSHPYNLEGSLLFQRPRNLLINLRPGLGDNVMQVGSNDGEYWAWIEPELARMWWGHHENTGKPCSQDVLINPSELVAAMGIGLPGPASGLIGPILKRGKETDFLDYTRTSSSGRVRFVQEYRVMREPPFLVEVVIVFDNSGGHAMTAHLSEYKPAWENGPLLAHKISIDWPKDGNKLNMAIGGFKPVDTDKLRGSAFARPTESPPLPPAVLRNVIQVDANCGPGFGVAPAALEDDARAIEQPESRDVASGRRGELDEASEASGTQDAGASAAPSTREPTNRIAGGPSSYETGEFDWPDDRTPEGP